MSETLLTDELVLEGAAMWEIRKQDRDLFSDDWVMMGDQVKHAYHSFHLWLLQNEFKRRRFVAFWSYYFFLAF